MPKHLVSINDLSKAAIEKIFDLADKIDADIKANKPIDICRDKIMATMFYEPSTRTRMSFESAMYRLGGKVISSADTKATSSAAKGESLIDTIKVIQHYADLVILRHFKDGSAKLAAENSFVPIISGGDGAHEHPTQTLCDLYTLRREKGKIKGLNIAICGDLRYGRTVHSLVYGLAKFGATIFTVAPDDFALPEHVERRLKTSYNTEVKKFKRFDEKLSANDVLFMKNLKKSKGVKEDIVSENLFQPIPIEYFDAIYVTRIQMERIEVAGRHPNGTKIMHESLMSYLVNKELLEKAKNDTIVLHPLPRRSELSYDIDKDKRAAYFKQAAYGVPVRMALIAIMLGAEMTNINMGFEKHDVCILDEDCSNHNCITQEEENIQHRYIKVEGADNTYRCFYCDSEKIVQV